MAADLNAPFPLAEKTAVSAAALQSVPLSKSSPTSSSLGEKGDLTDSDIEDGRLHGAYPRADGTVVDVSWTLQEQRRVVRKADLFLLPIFTLLFFWMALDRTNIAGVLTSTIMKDTKMTQQQINNGTSLLWLGIVLLEIPSNVILQRVGPHRWIPCQVIVWGVVEMLQSQVKNASGWYAARFFLGLCESGFIPGSLWILSQWYTRQELAKRTVCFFFGVSLSTAFGSLIAAGCIKAAPKTSLHGWELIFLVDGAGTMAAGILALMFLPKSARHTAGLFRGKGWFSDREADIFIARIERDDPLKVHRSHVHIGLKDIIGVLSDWRIWPHLLMCLTGLQATGGLQIWGGTIIKSLGFSSIRANLLSVPGPVKGCFVSLVVAYFIDRSDRRGLGIIFSSFWVVSGVIALYCLPIRLNDGQWSFYAALVFTQAAPIWQAFNVTWIALNARTPQRMAVTYAVYIGCSNLGGVYGGQVFRAPDAPRYRNAFAACLALAVIWVVIVVLQLIQYHISNHRKAAKWQALSAEEQAYYKETETDSSNKRLDFKFHY